jgi:oligoendopeptidase F
VKRIAKELIKVAIYPTQKQFLLKTEEFLSENYPEFYKRVSKKNWVSYYETNIFPPVSNANGKPFLYLNNN